MHSSHTRGFQNGPGKGTASEAVSEEENKEVLGSLNDTTMYLLKQAEITGSERAMQKTHNSAFSCVLVCLGSRCRCTVVFLFPVGRLSPVCFHLGKLLLDLWRLLSQSFTGSKTLSAASSNHCCPIT